MVTAMYTALVLLIAISARASGLSDETELLVETTELPESIAESNVFYIDRLDVQLDDQEARTNRKNISAIEKSSPVKSKNHQRRKNSTLNEAIQLATLQGLNAMIDLYDRKEPEILRKGEFLDANHPAAQLSLFSAPMTNETDAEVKGAYASLFAAKKLQESLNWDFTGFGRQASKKKLSLKRTSLEGLCPPRDPPQCLPATRRYRTHDGTCNNIRRPRWGSAQLPFHRFMSPDYSDGLETIRSSATGGSLPSSRFVSLVVHGYREDEAPITMLLPQWGQLIDHDVTATLQPRSINGSIPSCCRSAEPHPSCLPIKVPRDDPFLGSLGVRCLEFLRSAPAQRRDCFLSWREQTNQVTSFIDASPVYSSNPRTADSSRINRDGMLLFGRGPPREDACLRGGFGHQCIRAGDSRAGEQPGLLAMHTVFVAEHNRMTLELADLNPHWSDEKLYQETRRIIGAIFQHITYREFLPLVLGKEVCRLFDLELEPSGYSHKYDPKVNPTVANAFSAAAFRFGHALVQGSIMRSDINYRFLSNNVSLHEETSRGDIGGIGSLHRIIRGLSTQRTLKRDEFMSPELTNHLFQSSSFPFGMDLAAINIQRGRDHGLPSYVDWREPCGLSAIKSWADLEVISGPNSAERMRRAYDNVEDIDLFVGGISERPVVGGLVGPTFACIIAQQFNNLRKGDRFWYENGEFESSFTPAQLFSIRQVTLSQILCRSLGNSNFIQPHAFLPSEFSGNERARCGVGNLAPITLTPWVERDPFHKEGDFVNLNLVDTSNDNDIFMSVRPTVFETSTTAKPKPVAIIDRLDFENQVLITARPKPSTSKSRTTVDNKLDFSTTTSKPRRKRTTAKTTTSTARNPSPTLILDNKLDFEDKVTTKRPETPFSKLGKDSQLLKNSTTIVKSLTNKKRKKQKRSAESRSDELDLTDNSQTKTTFRNQDNATKYMNNKPASRLGDFFESRADDTERRYNGNNDNDYDYSDRPYRPSYDYSTQPHTYYPPYLAPTLSSTRKRPVAYENNRPNYEDTNFIHMRLPPRPTGSPISNKYSTPFSYDTYQNNPTGSISSLSPQINYDNMAIPLYVSPNRVSNRPPYQNVPYRPTTRKMDLSTFMLVETTRRTTPDYFNIRRTTQRPFFNTNLDLNYQISYSPKPSVLIYPSISISSSIDDSDDDNTKVSYFPSSLSINKISIKAPSHASSSDPFSNYKPLSVFSNDKSDEQFDGYLRPETSFYIPLKPKPSYNDYSKYNLKPETPKQSGIKFYYVGNVLHKHFEGKENLETDNDSDKDNDGLYDRQETKRYAEGYEEQLTKKKTEESEGDKMTRTVTNEKPVDDTDATVTKTLQFDGRSRKDPQNVFLVPFKLLTRIERPDNWVNTDETNDQDMKSRLPDVPALTQDSSVAKELPRPIFNRHNSFRH